MRPLFLQWANFFALTAEAAANVEFLLHTLLTILDKQAYLFGVICPAP